MLLGSGGGDAPMGDSAAPPSARAAESTGGAASGGVACACIMCEAWLRNSCVGVGVGERAERSRCAGLRGGNVGGAASSPLTSSITPPIAAPPGIALGAIATCRSGVCLPNAPPCECDPRPLLAAAPVPAPAVPAPAVPAPAVPASAVPASAVPALAVPVVPLVASRGGESNVAIGAATGSPTS